MARPDYPIRVDNWPTDSGPLLDLHAVGLLPDVDAQPAWLRYAKTLTDSAGGVTYKGSAQHVSGEGLRALAALTFEAWAVSITATTGGRWLEFTIRRER